MSKKQLHQDCEGCEAVCSCHTAICTLSVHAAEVNQSLVALPLCGCAQAFFSCGLAGRARPRAQSENTGKHLWCKEQPLQITIETGHSEPGIYARKKGEATHKGPSGPCRVVK